MSQIVLLPVMIAFIVGGFLTARQAYRDQEVGDPYSLWMASMHGTEYRPNPPGLGRSFWGGLGMIVIGLGGSFGLIYGAVVEHR